MAGDDVRKQVGALVDAAQKLLRETERLRRDVAAVRDRIKPFAGEVLKGRDDDLELDEAPRPKWVVVDALNVIAEARNRVVRCEQDLSAIRARIDSVAKDAHSWDEMKKWLKD